MRRCVLVAVFGVLCLSLPAGGQTEAKVRIVGGADGTGQNYTWKVTNLHDSRIVSVSFPHYHGDTFIVPTGWEQETTGLAQAGVKDAHLGGVCRAFVSNPKTGIGQRFDATFRLRIARTGAQRRPGEVTVQFADGSEAIVPDIELPTKPTFGERYIMAIGLGVIFLVIFLTTRKGKKPATDPGGE